MINRYWPRVMDERRDFQFQLLEGDEIVARACTIPVRWDGTVADLPAGLDDAIVRSFEEEGATALCAMLIAIPRAHRGKHVSTDALAAMRDIARSHGFSALIAPVRPTWKERYPLVAIERYMEWRREDGRAFDPWVRIHERFGGRILGPAPRSVHITGTVAEWEEWVGMPFPESGDYVFPHGLSTVRIDRETDVGEYWEPNVWMHHVVHS